MIREITLVRFAIFTTVLTTGIHVYWIKLNIFKLYFCGNITRGFFYASLGNMTEQNKLIVHKISLALGLVK
jgi:hypothetical protein